MKKDNDRNPAVSKGRAKTAPERQTSATQAPQRRLEAAPTTISARYIDSRLKQFCLR